MAVWRARYSLGGHSWATRPLPLTKHASSIAFDDSKFKIRVRVRLRVKDRVRLQIFVVRHLEEIQRKVLVYFV